MNLKCWYWLFWIAPSLPPTLSTSVCFTSLLLCASPMLSVIYTCIVHLQSGKWECLICILPLIHFPVKHFPFPTALHLQFTYTNYTNEMKMGQYYISIVIRAGCGVPKSIRHYFILVILCWTDSTMQWHACLFCHFCSIFYSKHRPMLCKYTYTYIQYFAMYHIIFMTGSVLWIVSNIGMRTLTKHTQHIHVLILTLQSAFYETKWKILVWSKLYAFILFATVFAEDL